jgi:hypothetical protein
MLLSLLSNMHTMWAITCGSDKDEFLSVLIAAI